MSREIVGKHEAEDINAVIEKVLRDLGYPDPPLNLTDVRLLLDLNLGFYSTSNDSLLKEVAHRIKVAGKQVLERPMLLVEAVEKANLSALWLPDAKRILIDKNVPKPKHRWIEGHEIGHSLIPWHREFLFGDNEFTLDPICHAMVEAEANFASSRLLFLQNKFGAEARDCDVTFESVKKMAKRYGNTITSTLWRFVEDRDPESPIFGMITAHPHHADIGTGPGGEKIRYFIRSKAFKEQFNQVKPQDAFEILSVHANRRRGGPIVETLHDIHNDNGEICEFKIEGFCNKHSVLTFGVFNRLLPTTVSVP